VKGGNYGGKYTFGPANEEIYGVRGAWSDYAYAATWDTQYTAPEFLTNGSRSLAIGVEITNDPAPPESSLGNSQGVYDPGGTNDGLIPKNIRMALVLADTAEPYIDWKDREEIPSIAYPGQNITLEWEVMGAFKADETQLNYEVDWSNGAPSTIDQYQTTNQNGWSGWYGNTFSEQITMPQEPGDYYFVISAVVDQTSLEQTIPEPDIEPQSLYVNQRTNESWEVSNNGNIMNGQVVWYSEVIHIEVQESGFIYITDHPQVAETKTIVQLNWTVGVGSNYVINQTQILWGNSSDPMNSSKFTENGILVEEQIVDPNIIYSYFSNITMLLDPGQYYFIAKVRLDDIQTQAVHLELWSQVVEIVVGLPPDGYGLEVSTPVVEYTGNLTQQIDILGVEVSCPSLGIETCDANMLNIHQYTIYSNENIIFKKGDLSWTGLNWQAVDINVSSFPENYYYVTGYFEHDLGNGSNNHTSGDSSEFYLNHILIITQPVLEVTDGKMRILNITNVTIKNSYLIPPGVHIINITRFKYTIENYTNHWKPIMLGELNWTGGQWQALNINLSKYGKGEYRVNFYFYSSYHYQDYTVEFNITYTEVFEDPDEDGSDSEPDDISVYYVIVPVVIIILIMFFVYFLHKDRKKQN
jgi:hypothetical protein